MNGNCGGAITALTRAHRVGMGPAALDGERMDAHQDIDLGLGRRTAIGAAGERLGGLPRLSLKELLGDPGQHIVPDQEDPFEEHRRDRVGVAGARDFVGQISHDRRVDAEEVAQGVAELDLGHAVNNELAGILGAQDLHARDPVGEHLPFLVGGLFLPPAACHAPGRGQRILPEDAEAQDGEVFRARTSRRPLALLATWQRLQ
jgi:hypothetical protein